MKLKIKKKRIKSFLAATFLSFGLSAHAHTSKGTSPDTLFIRLEDSEVIENLFKYYDMFSKRNPYPIVLYRIFDSLKDLETSKFFKELGQANIRLAMDQYTCDIMDLLTALRKKLGNAPEHFTREFNTVQNLQATLNSDRDFTNQELLGILSNLTKIFQKLLKTAEDNSIPVYVQDIKGAKSLIEPASRVLKSSQPKLAFLQNLIKTFKKAKSTIPVYTYIPEAVIFSILRNSVRAPALPKGSINLGPYQTGTSFGIILNTDQNAYAPLLINILLSIGKSPDSFLDEYFNGKLRTEEEIHFFQKNLRFILQILFEDLSVLTNKTLDSLNNNLISREERVLELLLTIRTRNSEFDNTFFLSSEKDTARIKTDWNHFTTYLNIVIARLTILLGFAEKSELINQKLTEHRRIIELPKF